MCTLRPTRTSRLLLGLACCLALLAPAGAAAWSPPGPAGPRALAEGTDGPGQAHLRDPMAGSLAAPGNRRDDRERHGLALPGLLAAAVVPAAAGVAAHRAVRATRRRSTAAAGARAPPALQPAPS
jgi:peptidoglycan/LPS O-acetylase OafA/YrhL